MLFLTWLPNNTSELHKTLKERKESGLYCLDGSDPEDSTEEQQQTLPEAIKSPEESKGNKEQGMELRRRSRLRVSVSY